MSGHEPELLSQEEIDALLAQIEAEAAPAGDTGAPGAPDDAWAGVFGQLVAALRPLWPEAGPGPERVELLDDRELADRVADASASWIHLGGPVDAPLLVAVSGGGVSAEVLAGALAAELSRRWGRATARVGPAPAGPHRFAVASFPGAEGGRLLLALPVDAEPRVREALAAPAAAGGGEELAAAVYPELQPVPAAAGPGRIDLLLDVPLEVTVELGRTRRQVRELLALGPGSLVELDKLAGEAVDVLVNGKLIARGEVVVIDEYFGVRITEIVSPAERLQRLR